ncbi:MAG: hypothetical protein PVJ53_04280 [Desulfobacterales bacterium]|jgi:hypothetical protein
MNRDHRPVRTTIIIGGAGTLAYMIAYWGLRWHWAWPAIASAIIWLTMATYAVALARWSGRGPVAIVFPLLVLGAIGMDLSPSGWTLILALAMLSWIRSGICYPGPVLRSLLREFILCGGPGLIILLWGPSTSLSWALGIWFFSLVQALFFILFEAETPSRDEPLPDSFERAARRIESLLDG